LLRKTVHNRVEKFSHGHSKVADDTRPGRLVETATEAIVQLEKALIRADRRITTDSVASALECFHGLAYMMHDRLRFRKVCARWVPRELKDREKINRMGLSLHLLRYADETEDMLNRIIIWNGSWMHHYQLESKRAPMQWKGFADGEEVETEVQMRLR
jgi:hypothetical protein